MPVPTRDDDVKRRAQHDAHLLELREERRRAQRDAQRQERRAKRDERHAKRRAERSGHPYAHVKHELDELFAFVQTLVTPHDVTSFNRHVGAVFEFNARQALAMRNEGGLKKMVLLALHVDVVSTVIARWKVCIKTT